MMLQLYHLLSKTLKPLLKHHLKKRIARGKEDPARLHERFGQAKTPRPDGFLVWIHCASVGESLSILPLLDQLKDSHPNHTALVTTGTVTSAQLMADRLPDHALHQYVPLDLPSAVNTFLDHWRPNLALWVESELWPNLVMATHKRAIPMALLNGRMSERSFIRWRRVPWVIRPLLSAFHLILAQSKEDAQRFQKLGCANASAAGNLKYAAPALTADQAILARFQTQLKDRPLWLAASTHEGDEALVAQVHHQLKQTHPRALTLIAPRHPERGPTLAKELRDQGYRVALRSQNDTITDQTDLYIADTMGEMGIWYHLCPIVFIGKSLVNKGGQNPLEPARLNCALISGPHMDNFQAITESFLDQEALIIAESAADVSRSLDLLFKNPKHRDSLAQQAAHVAFKESSVLDHYAMQLAPFFTDDAS